MTAPWSASVCRCFRALCVAYLCRPSSGRTGGTVADKRRFRSCRDTVDTLLVAGSRVSDCGDSRRVVALRQVR